MKKTTSLLQRCQPYRENRSVMRQLHDDMITFLLSTTLHSKMLPGTLSVCTDHAISGV